MEFHDIANVFPMLSNAELEALAADIAENGMHHSITTYQGKILDGRNRYVACELADIEPTFTEYTGNSPVAFVISENITRRHLDESQRAMCGGRLANMQEGRPKTASIDAVSQSEAAKMLNVSRPSVQRARVVLDHGLPELIDAVDQGKIAVSKASQIARLPEAEQRQEIEHRPHVANNSGNNEWYTPPEYIEAARRVMGGIDCDPASSEAANRTVKAATFYTAQDDGLLQHWTGRVWMNPPYAQPLVAQFCETLIMQLQHGIVTEACVLVNNATDTGWFHTLLELTEAVCFIRGRVHFLDQQGNPSGAPLQGQAVLYFGANVERFSVEFSPLGVVLYARCARRNLQSAEGCTNTQL